MKIKEYRPEDQPREKLKNLGASNLTIKELLCIIIGSGCPKYDLNLIIDEILKLVNEDSDLKRLSYFELLKINGIGEAKALQIIASIEIGYRIVSDQKNKLSIKTIDDIFSYFQPKFKYLDQEELYTIFYDKKGNVIDIILISKGTGNETVFNSNLIFKWCYKLSSNNLILVHNHPSGDSTPSLADVNSTMDFVSKANVLGINLIDHIIIGNNYFSMRKSIKEFKNKKINGIIK